MSIERISPAKIRPLMKDGSMTMLALDQRGSLRTILANGKDEREITDDHLVAFKTAATEILSPLASAVLLDSGLGRQAMRLIPAGVPLILSADKFEQKPGGPVERSDVDPPSRPPYRRVQPPSSFWSSGTKAPGGVRRDVSTLRGPGAENRGSHSWKALCETRRRAFHYSADHGEAVLEAACELVETGPDVYRPKYPISAEGLGEVSGFATRLTRRSLGLGGSVQWRRRCRFRAGCALCCKGGASGFGRPRHLPTRRQV